MPPTIYATAEALLRRETTATKVLEQCLSRIEELDSRLKAWVFVAQEQALRQAESLDQELAQGKSRGPLHGIPIGVKDIFDVYDWPTAAGSKRWQNSIARHDSTVVEKLRQAGAVLVGKTVTTQFASFDPPPTRNPWNESRTPGGSSSGSAAAVAAGMCLAAIGSQTGGSITRPASFCGIAGLKPSYGHISCHGVVPLAPSMDHPGPMANCVRDLAILYDVLAGDDSKDPNSLFFSRGTARIPHSDPPTLGRLRGIFEERAEPEANAMMDRVCAQLSENGATIQEVTLPASFSEMESRHRIIMAVEAATYHQARFWEHPSDYLPNITALIEEGLQCPAPEYVRAKELQSSLTDEILARFMGVNAFVMPGARGPAPDASTTGDPIFNSPWSLTGLPAVSFLADWVEEMPQAFQLVGRDDHDGELLAIAEWCERTLQIEKREVS